MVEQGGYLINEVARRVNLSQKRIREYESEGFIRPKRDAKTNNRRYTECSNTAIGGSGWLFRRFSICGRQS